MKKQILSIVIGTIVLAFLFGTLQAQNVTLTFTGRDATTNAYVQLSRVEITDLTQGWTETLTFPDTVAILTVGTGIEENAADATFCLAQNNPNPFNGTTNVNLTVADAGAVTLEIVDGNGKIVGTRHGTSLQPGTHKFRVSLSTAGTYVLTARQNGKTSSIKMVCNGAGNGNSIEYIGSVSQSLQPQNDAKGNINRAFAYGDAMTYKGYAEKFGMEIEGEIKAQTQILSETITLLFYCDGQPCPGTPVLTDIDGNTYNTVLIGNQCWMKENLRTTLYANNTFIAHGSSLSNTTAYWYYPNNDASNKPTYGLLYNWPAVMHGEVSSVTNPSNVQGICPNGWHVPSDAEWRQLTDYVRWQSEYVCGNGHDYNIDYIAKALAATTGWDSCTDTCAVGNTPSNNNATGFSALPAGYYLNGYYNFGVNAIFWSATEIISTEAYYCRLFYNATYVVHYVADKDRGYSVRCLRD